MEIIQPYIKEKTKTSQNWLVCLAISRWFSGEMLDRTYMINSVSKPHSLTHINLPMSIICFHINPKTALSTAFMFLTMSSTPLASPPHSLFSLSWHEKSNWVHCLKWNTDPNFFPKFLQEKLKNESTLWQFQTNYIDSRCNLTLGTSGRSEPWSTSTAQLVNHVIAWNSSLVIPKCNKYFFTCRVPGS